MNVRLCLGPFLFYRQRVNSAQPDDLCCSMFGSGPRSNGGD